MIRPRRRIPLLVPGVPGIDQVRPWLERIDTAQVYTNFGPLVLQFEQQLSALWQPSPAITTVSNATVGLELALASVDLQPRARVLVPALTFAATATAIVRAGYEPVFGDVDPRSWLLTPDIAYEAVRSYRVHAVLPVAAYGCPQSVAQWDRFTNETGLPVVIDAAGAFGNQAVGDTSTVIFSLHATKALGVGEGGIVASRSDRIVRCVRQAANFGLTPHGVVVHGGTNAKLSEFHAAVGLAALAAWPHRNNALRQLRREYLEALECLHPVVTWQETPGSIVAPILPLRLIGIADIEAVRSLLSDAGIETRRWYCPILPQHPLFSGFTAIDGVPVARQLSTELLGVPFHTSLQRNEMAYVVERLRSALERVGPPLRRAPARLVSV